MSFDSDWDVDKYRADYESAEHWNLKAKFINAHKTRFPEEELICLAQVFFNIEFMGCRYPAETMTLVAELSKDVAREFRESRRNRLQRTFVTASDAVGARYSKADNMEQSVSTRKLGRIEFYKAKDEGTATTSTADNVYNKRRGGDFSEEVVMPKRPKIEPNDDPVRIFYNEMPDFIIFQGLEDDPPPNIIRTSAGKNKLTMKYVQPKHACVYIHFNDRRMNNTPGESKNAACAALLTELRKYFYTIKRKTKFLSRTKEIDKTDERLTNKAGASTVADPTKIDSNNLGFKLLKSLGWSGGGLGRKNTGIEDPIEAQIKIGRAGLGKSESGGLDKKLIRNLFYEYKMSNDLCDLVFSTEFTKEERAVIHSIAKSCKLKSSSFGKDKHNNRQIVINRASSARELFVELQNNTDPLSKEKWEIIPPTELSS